MLLLVGQVGSDFVDREAFQEIDFRRMYAPIAKWAAQVDRAERVPEYIARAYHVATSGRTRAGGAGAARGHAARVRQPRRRCRCLPRRARRPGPPGAGAGRSAACPARRCPLAAGDRGRQRLDGGGLRRLRRFVEANALPLACGSATRT